MLSLHNKGNVFCTHVLEFDPYIRSLGQEQPSRLLLLRAKKLFFPPNYLLAFFLMMNLEIVTSRASLMHSQRFQPKQTLISIC
jgi:hypothetical protein